MIRSYKIDRFNSTAGADATLVAPPPSAVNLRRNEIDAVAKRGCDIVVALIALVFFAPFMVLIAVIIILSDGWPVVYSQERIGFRGKPFRCYKFRTMSRDADARLKALLLSNPEARIEWEENRKLRDDPRITCIGGFLRKSSLDELPQFWNALRGDMSIVGPRPIVADEARQYGDHFGAYTSLRPGITGLWQVSGRSDTSYERRVSLDCDYAARRTLRMDVAIMFRTVKVVFRREGAR